MSGSVGSWNSTEGLDCRFLAPKKVRVPSRPHGCSPSRLLSSLKEIRAQLPFTERGRSRTWSLISRAPNCETRSSWQWCITFGQAALRVVQRVPDVVTRRKRPPLGNRAMIDVIIPYYDVDEWCFLRLLSSLGEQTMRRELRLLIADDCSKATNISRAEELLRAQGLDYRILRQDRHRGPGYARQKALDNARREFVYFIDADDRLYSTDSLEILCDAIRSGESDIARGFVISYRGDRIVHSRKGPSVCMNLGIHGYLVRRSFLLEHPTIRFEEKWLSEVDSFTSRCNVLSSYVQPRVFSYVHYFRDGSASDLGAHRSLHQLFRLNSVLQTLIGINENQSSVRRREYWILLEEMKKLVGVASNRLGAADLFPAAADQIMGMYRYLYREVSLPAGRAALCFPEGECDLEGARAAITAKLRDALPAERAGELLGDFPWNIAKTEAFFA